MPTSRRKTSQPSKRRTRQNVSYPALLLAQNNQRFYFSTVPVDDLAEFCFVSRRDEDPLRGFQRTLDEKRADDIAIYLAHGNGSIPSNIVLSAQDVAHLAYSPSTKSISFERVPKAFLVLDGQHRLWGYQKSKTRHRVPVAIYQGLDRAQEAKLFIDINTHQKGVPAALLLDIKQIAQVESQREHILRELFDELRKNPRSPLAGKLSPARSVRNKISRVTFNRAMGPLLDRGALLDAEDRSRLKLVLNYINAFDAELLDKALLVRAGFFEAIMGIFDEVIRAAVVAHGDARQESIQVVIRPAAQADYSIGLRLTKRGYEDVLKAALRKTVAISEDML